MYPCTHFPRLSTAPLSPRSVSNSYRIEKGKLRIEEYYLYVLYAVARLKPTHYRQNNTLSFMRIDYCRLPVV
jgi:hypothetical protein